MARKRIILLVTGAAFLFTLLAFASAGDDGSQHLERNFKTSESAVVMDLFKRLPKVWSLKRKARKMVKNLPEYEGMTDSTRDKALSELERLGLVLREGSRMLLTKECVDMVLDHGRTESILRDAAEKYDSLREFVHILEDSSDSRLTLNDLGSRLNRRLDAGWKDATAEVNAKILMDWARQVGICPAAYRARERRRLK